MSESNGDLFEQWWQEGSILLPPERRPARFWTVLESAMVLRKKPSAVRKFLADHPGMSTRVGGTIWIDQFVLHDWLKARSDRDDSSFGKTRQR